MKKFHIKLNLEFRISLLIVVACNGIVFEFIKIINIFSNVFTMKFIYIIFIHLKTIITTVTYSNIKRSGRTI